MNNENTPCSCNDSNDVSQIMENYLCPQCEQPGMPVPLETVKHQVKTKYRSYVDDLEYSLCMHKDCKTAYFAHNSKNVLDHSLLKRPLWYKSYSEKILLCYCLNITENEVIRTVVETGLTESDLIMMHLRGRFGWQCKITNPTGKCCSDEFQAGIELGIKVRNNILISGILAADIAPVDREALQKASDLALNCGDTKKSCC